MRSIGTVILGLAIMLSWSVPLAAQDARRVLPPVDRIPPRLPKAPPTVTAVAPAGVPNRYPATVTIDGSAFVPGTTVTIGGVAATGVALVSDTRLRASTVPGVAGAKDVVVTTASGTATCAGCLTYDDALSQGEYIEEQWERGGEGPVGVWRTERYQKGFGTNVLVRAQCPEGWLPVGAGISNVAMTPFNLTQSYPVDNTWRVLMERRMVPPVGGQLLFPPAPYSFFVTLTCLDRDAFNRVMRPTP